MKALSRLFFVVFILTAGLYSEAQVKYSNEFMSIGAGARALGMSNAVIASANDVSALYWNPAGLVSLPSPYEVGAMHAEYFAGLANYDFLGGAFKTDAGSYAGISMLRFGVDNIPNTLELVDEQGNMRYDRIREFSVADYAFLFSYARALKPEGLAVGGNVKIIHRITGDFANAWGFGVDASLHYMKNRWQFGILLRDATSTFNAWRFNTEELKDVFLLTGNEIPENSLEITRPRLLTGVSRTFRVSEKMEVLTEIDADFTFDGQRHVLVNSSWLNVDPHLGIEANYKKLVFVRCGVGNFQNQPDFSGKESLTLQPNLGLGLKLWKLQVDYALTDIGNASAALYSNVFSLRFFFGRPENQQ